MYEKQFRAGPDMDSLMDILTPIEQGLLKEQVEYPFTIVYIPLKKCGFAYKMFESVFGYQCQNANAKDSENYPFGSMQILENRLFAQFYSPQTKKMKNEI